MHHRLWHRPWLIGISLAGLVFIAYHYGLLDVLELKALDVRFRLRGPLSPRLPIVIVSIDQDSFDELGLPWPWPRSLHAELIQKLAVQQATLIVLDILFAEPKADPAEDHALAEAIQMAGNVVLAEEYTQVPGAFGPKLSMNLPIPVLRERALGYGPVNVIPDQDGVVRSALLGLPFQDRIRSLPSWTHALLFSLLTALTIGCAVSLKPLRAVGLITGLGSSYAILTMVFFTRYHGRRGRYASRAQNLHVRLLVTTWRV